VWEAKQEEALSYMKMMKTDVGAAEQRVRRLESMQRAGAMERLVQRKLERVSISCPVSAY